ncbi:ATP-dependent nuclease [Arthrobacter sp. TWP1-1]|uniref:ATP-dependent nuclease n=1 Tax=Arthrobacter sp. TWP1-1 TaxID=2804568 RepID=UPI003CE8A490
MKIKSIEIANFKAIKRAKLDLHPNFNVLVGTNGSGKSSVLQALHWMFQSGRNPAVKPRAAGEASTLSERDAIYMPSQEYKSAGHGSDYGNFKNNPQLDLVVVAIDGNGAEVQADMWLKSARNEGISVHVPTGNQIVGLIRDRKREISAYIPGVAGIPLVEEKRSKQIVHRSAAAGDANTVLRNMLDLLRRETIGGKNGLEFVSELVARVMGDFALKVEFDDDLHSHVIASFRVGEMGSSGDKSFRPLELAGIGYLQVLQIFCYLVYFQPLLLLVDEPDAHLYPIAQERLVEVLSEVAQEFGSQVLMTTHSPSIVRALPLDSKVIWMKGGEVEPSGDANARQQMGWGLLDRKIILLTEDSKTGMLRSLLSQWPELERVTAIWPFHGTGKLPQAEVLDGLKVLLGNGMRLVIHRDRDFLMPEEISKLAKPYEAHGHRIWATRYSDIEAYWATPEAISAHFGISVGEATLLLESAIREANKDEEATTKRRNKRRDALNKLNDDGKLPQFGDVEVLEEVAAEGPQFGVLGKSMIGCIRAAASRSRLDKIAGFGNFIPAGLTSFIADDLRVLLESLK